MAFTKFCIARRRLLNFRSVKIILWLSAILLAGCATIKKPLTLRAIPDQGPVRLELNPVVGTGDTSEYHSRTMTKNFSNGDIVRKGIEEIDFVVETKVVNVDAAHKQATFKLQTISKEGHGDLSDFAMPEVGEELELILNNRGKVLRAGDFPPGTLYFVPPISLPEKEVAVGDTWPMTAEWISLKSSVPLRMEIVSIYKGLRDCAGAGPCAEVEVSGGVSIIGAKNNTLAPKALDDKDLKLRFKSELRGRLLISLRQGLVLYSFVRTDEQLTGEKDRSEISSCMVSYVTKPENIKLALSGGNKCDPQGEVPSLSN